MSLYEDLIDKIRDELLQRVDLVMDEDDEVQEWTEEWYSETYGHGVKTGDIDHFVYLQSKIAEDVTIGVASTLLARVEDMRRERWSHEAGEGNS